MLGARGEDGDLAIAVEQENRLRRDHQIPPLGLLRQGSGDPLRAWCIIWPMSTTDSGGCCPLNPIHADRLFLQMVSTFSRIPESVVDMFQNQWSACSRIWRSRTDPIGSGAG